MSQKPPYRLNSGNFLQVLTVQIKLIIRLICDRRVHPLLKLLPLVPALYFIFPDLLIGPVDDGLIVWLGSYLFLELCPPLVVEEHRNQLMGIDTRSVDGVKTGEVIDVKFSETNDQQPGNDES